MSRFILIIQITFILLWTSCARKQIDNAKNAMRLQESSQFTLADDISLDDFLSGLRQHIKILKIHPQKKLRFGEKEISHQEYADALTQLLPFTQKEELLSYINKHFNFYEVYGRKQWGQILLTSYYQPEYPARIKPSEKYSQPLYKLPKDLVQVHLSQFNNEGLTTLSSDRKRVAGRIIHQSKNSKKIVPFYNRHEIDVEKRLASRKLELYYMDPIHAFFLQIQGSGTLVLKNGKKVSVGYHGQNGWRYQSIGKYLFHIIPREEMSLQKIEKHLRTLNQKDLYEFLDKNPSYVFFKKIQDKGRTTFGNKVIAGRTLAIDKSLLPIGALAYLTFQKPQYQNEQPVSFQKSSRLVLAQDTGGAIKSAGRADLFWGSGEQALQHAGVMRHSANLWFLFPKSEVLK